MALSVSSDKLVKIFGLFSAEEQAVWLKAMEETLLISEARELSQSLKKAPKISMSEIVNEVNKVRKENGYMAYSI